MAVEGGCSGVQLAQDGLQHLDFAPWHVPHAQPGVVHVLAPGRVPRFIVYLHSVETPAERHLRYGTGMRLQWWW